MSTYSPQSQDFASSTAEILALPWQPPTRLKAALDYAAIGWSVFPVHSIGRGGACSCGTRNCANAGKHPRTSNGLMAATTDPKTIRQWFTQWPDANIAVAAGPSGLVILDEDPRNGGDVNLAALITKHAELTGAVVSQTGGGGRHFIFAANGEALPGTLCPGVDIKKGNGYILLPPSNHASGGTYQWSDGQGPFSADVQIDGLAPLPDWVAEVTASKSKRIENGTPTATPAEQVEIDFEDFADAARAIRNDEDIDRDEWLKIGAAIHHQTRGDEKGFRLFDEWSQEHDSYDADATHKAWVSFGRYSGKPITGRSILQMARERGWRPAFEVSDRLVGDLTLARQFAREHAHEFRFVAETKVWLRWDGLRWNRHLAADEAFSALQRMLGRNLNIVSKRQLDAALAEGGDEKDRSQSADEAKREFNILHAYLKDSRKMRAVLGLVPSQRNILTSATTYDRDTMLLGVRNGVLDLRTGELLAPDPARNITKTAGCTFNPQARCPKFLVFLERIIPDPASRDFLRRACGYTLTGSVDEEKLFFAHGVGRNGKSVLANILSALLGDYAVTIDPGLLMASSQGKNEAARSIARLPGARLALMNETPTHALWDDGAVKALASREAIQARELYREAFDFFPTHKLWIRGNHLPGARDASDGFWRRMVAVKFGEQIGAGEIISNLDRQIIDEELSGVLAWALKGCRDWQASGLKIPASVAKEIDAYRAESDTLGQWLEEETERAPDGRLPAKAAFASYSLFCAEHGLKPGSETAFGRAMAERGLTKYRAMRERGYEGLRLRDATGAFEGGEDAT